MHQAVERLMEWFFLWPANSRFAFGDREAAALRADLDFDGQRKSCSAMRSTAQSVSHFRPAMPGPLHHASGALCIVSATVAGAAVIALMSTGAAMPPTPVAAHRECNAVAEIARELGFDGVAGAIGGHWIEPGRSLKCGDEFLAAGVALRTNEYGPSFSRLYYRGKNRAVLFVEDVPEGGCGTAPSERLSIARSGTGWRIVRREPWADTIYDCFFG